jgi:hypothetical protein
MDEHMTLKDWMLTILIMCIPCVNIVMTFVWAFGSNVNPSKKTFFQACLIWYAIGLVFYFILVALGIGTAFATSQYAISALLLK